MRHLSIGSKFEAEEELKRVGVDPYGIKAMIPKMTNLNILLEGIECKVGNILKQEMLSCGGDVAVARGSVECSIEKTDALIIGTIKQLEALADKLSIQPFGLKRISIDLKNLLFNLARDSFVVRMPRREILMGKKTLCMGVINVTPDSFSDGGLFANVEDAVAALDEMGFNPVVIGDSAMVVRQFPLSGAELNRGANITLYSNIVIGVQSDRIKVPNLKGKTMREAVQHLVQLNLDVNVNGSGIVKSQYPDAGSLVNYGTVCTIACNKR